MKHTTQHQQRGLGLIEIMVAVLVLSVGVMGVATLQTRSLKNNYSALANSMATIQTYSIIDAMRVARSAAIAGDFNLALADEPAGTGFAADALSSWRSSLKTLLGSQTKSSVQCVDTLCTVIVQWDDSRALAGSEEQQINIEVRL